MGKLELFSKRETTNARKQSLDDHKSDSFDRNLVELVERSQLSL